MKKLILGILIGLGITAGIAYATNDFWDNGDNARVQRFQDGDINCYIILYGGFHTPAGISCVNWKTVIQ